MRKSLHVLGLVLAFLFLLTACAKDNEASTKEQEKSKASEKTTTEKGEPTTKVYPLTGLPAGDDDINRRVLAVMVNNHALARPQSGLHKADIVYEALTEARITRFLAIFQSQKPEVIGPVRSARHYFVDLSQGYGAIYIAHGWSPQAEKKLKSGGIDYIQGLYHDGTWFKRASFRQAPHNSYLPYDNAIEGAKTKGYDLTQDVKPLPFLEKAEVSKIPGNDVGIATITYSSDNVVSYVYHSEDGLFYRHINGEQAEDRETKTPLTAANVFIVSSDHSFINNNNYRRDIDLTKGGPAYLLQHGKVQKLEWKNVDGRLLPYKDGTAVKFVPGQTWINIVESDPGLDKLVTLTD
ncbi:hypothetical protein JOD43_002930 [Pullulanibacillus pueri]|uniref:Putative lipoprotein YerB n=1 Tax=Pullulanibacillus pueri TaxID=1437324 RepID=A0A8J2ZWV7_9BACL|nr:DUF3048 domain-containing protein [Pullulanibacillus pueri]MBM7682751.1 hypothetical protein [Pullulanibacillus pueri]GGH83047.1 putative lipoprotein YerB [Pullulanibacillus pueri]